MVVLPSPGGAVKQHVIQGFAAADGRLHGNAQHLLQLPLADVVGKPLGPQAVVLGATPSRIKVVLCLPRRID